jgi:hypothetical protein
MYGLGIPEIFILLAIVGGISLVTLFFLGPTIFRYSKAIFKYLRREKPSN